MRSPESGTRRPNRGAIIQTVGFKIEIGALSGLADGALVSFSGPIDAKNIHLFQQQMDALRQRHYRRFVLQMGEVRYINSTGLSYLITMVEDVQAAGGALVLFNVLPKVKVILESMGLTELLRVYPSKAAAVRELKAAVPAPTVPAPATPEAAPTPGTIRRLFRRLFGHPDERKI
jgi:anti-anti-sigma factor